MKYFCFPRKLTQFPLDEEDEGMYDCAGLLGYGTIAYAMVGVWYGTSTTYVLNLFAFV